MLKLKFVLLSVLVLFFTENSICCASSVTAIDFQKVPDAGKDAFYLRGPNIMENQSVLVVPSNHTLNLRYVTTKIATAMKAANVLITEAAVASSNPEFQSWDPATVISGSFKNFPLAKLKEFKLIQDKPFMFENKPWTQSLKPEDLQFLTKNLKPALANIPLENVHPMVVLTAISLAVGYEVKRFGMDSQIEHQFILNGKPILGLEPVAEILAFSDDGYKKMLGPVSAGHIKTLEQDIKSFQDVASEPPKDKVEKARTSIATNMKLFPSMLSVFTKVDTLYKMNESKPEVLAQLKQHIESNPSAKASFDRVSDVFKRNQNWIPVLIKQLDAHKKQSIVIVVGANHFAGDKGLFKLLSEKGYTFTRF